MDMSDETIKDLITYHKLGVCIEEPYLKNVVDVIEYFFEDFELGKQYVINSKYRFELVQTELVQIELVTTEVRVNEELRNEILYCSTWNDFWHILNIYFGLETLITANVGSFWCEEVHITKPKRDNIINVSSSNNILYDSVNDIKYEFRVEKSNLLIKGEYYLDTNMIDISTLEFFDTFYDTRNTDICYMKEYHVLLISNNKYYAYVYKTEYVENDIYNEFNKLGDIPSVPISDIIRILKKFKLVPRETEYEIPFVSSCNTHNDKRIAYLK